MPPASDPVYLVRLEVQPGARAGRVAFPKPVDWARRMAAAVYASDRILVLAQPPQIHVGAAPVPFPPLPRWQPGWTVAPLDEAFYSFRIPLQPVGPPAAGPD